MAQEISDHMFFLGLNKTQIEDWALQTLPDNTDTFTVGGVIARTDNQGTKRILILKRAAHQKYFPGLFEIPGGNIEHSDSMIIDSVTRVVREETGIHVKKVVAPLTPFTYTTEKRPGPGDTIRENAFHLSYLVNVKEKGDDFVVNPNEHSEGLWVKVDELDSVPMTDEMRKLVTEAFETSW